MVSTRNQAGFAHKHVNTKNNTKTAPGPGRAAGGRTGGGRHAAGGPGNCFCIAIDCIRVRLSQIELDFLLKPLRSLGCITFI